ncbi:Reverse transcriptase [Camponotus japonicus]
MAQVVTGHGCFGHYLCRIGREPTPRCHHCEEDRDTAQHTLEACPAWEVQHRALVAVMSEDLSLAAVVEAMLRGQEQWRAVSTFCEEVIRAKEEAERDRRRMPPPGQRGAADRRIRHPCEVSFPILKKIKFL